MDGPVEDVLVFEAAAVEEVFEELLVLSIVRGLLELELSAMRHVLGELFGVAVAQLLYGGVDLALLDLAILVVLVPSAEALPRQLSLEEVEDHVTSTLEVVSPALFNTQVGVGRGISCGACKTLLVSEWYVLIRRRILPALSQTEVNQIQGLGVLLHANEDVLGLQVAMDVSHLMEELNPADELIGNDQDRLE